MKTRRDIAIVGAGITGLVIAYQLKKMGHNVRVFESAKEVGGAIKTVIENGWHTESGPNTVLLKDQRIRDFIENELNLEEELIFANDKSAKRYIVKNGKPQALPTSPLAFLFSPFFSLSAKMDLLKEPFIPPKDPKNLEEETVAAFVRRRLGKEFLDYAINPFIAGVYAGNPEHLSVSQAFPKLVELEQEYGSLIKGQLKGAKKRKEAGRENPDKARIFSFKEGLQTLPKKLASFLTKELRIEHRITEVKPKYFSWDVTQISNGRYKQSRFDKVVFACGASGLGQIDGPWVMPPTERVVQPPVTVVSLGFKRSDVWHALDGFGMLVPEVENRKILGCLFSSSLFDDRAPYDHVLLTCFVGGTRQPKLTEMANQRLIDLVYLELDELLGIKGPYVFAKVDRWKNAIPQYNLGYDKIKELIAAVEGENKDIYFAGNFMEGISVGDCILHAFKMAERIDNES